jgi:hypothetical protein
MRNPLPRLVLRGATLLEIAALAGCGHDPSREERVQKLMLAYGSQAVSLDKAMAGCREKSRSACASAQQRLRTIVSTNRQICDLDATQSMCPFDPLGWQDRSGEVDAFAAAANLK